MDKALIIAAILIALGGGYALFTYSKRAALPPAPLQELQVTTASEREEADTYTIDAEYPQFGMPEIDAKIKERVGLSIAQFKKDAAEGPPPPDSVVQQYEFVSRFDSAYVGPDIVSAQIVTSSYMGGAHPMPIVNGLNFDRATGRDIALVDAFSMVGLSLEEIAEKAKKELQDKLGSDIIAPEGAGPTPENYSTFVIDKDRVTFIFQVYQVGPYSAGPQEVPFQRVR